MLEFIQLIKQRYQNQLTLLDKKSAQYYHYQQCITQLSYSEAFILKSQLIAAKTRFPVQIAVIGPTQVGKSSIVNLLLQADLAGVSPLAGYTVHPEGFCHDLSKKQLEGIANYFADFECVDLDQLNPNKYNQYSLTESRTKSDFLPSCVVWDTPDFDSIDACHYSQGVIKTIALADVIVLVVSKEKYADQTVWEMLKTISSFKQPTLICLNKINEEGLAEVLQSFQEKWLQYRTDPLPEWVALNYEKAESQRHWSPSAQHIIFKLSKQIKHKDYPLYQQQMMARYSSDWLAPIYAEHQAKQSWESLLDSVLKQALEDYQRDYLNHPHHYETFQAAMLNLLTLLELPGIAGLMAKSRHILTWPMRKLFNLGQQSLNNQPVQEIELLKQIGEHVIIQLADKLLEKNEQEDTPVNWWRDTAVQLRQKRPEILNQYHLAITEYHVHFQQDVQAAAQRLYHRLQEHPMLLNSIRATRFTTDTAAVLFALQAGGLGLHDLLLAPMLLSFSSLLAESSIGSYMTRVETELKQQQLRTVKQELFDKLLRHKLLVLPLQSLSHTHFNISAEQCQQFEQAIKEKKHGLRLL